MDYSMIMPQAGYIVIKELKRNENSALKTAGDVESSAYGKVISIADDSNYALDEIVLYNEFEGQELTKFGKINEDGIIIIKESDILAVINKNGI